VARGSRRWHSHVQEASTQVLPVLNEEDKVLFAKKPPGFGEFPREVENCTSLQCLMI
jgi:hypothetical protein